MKRLLNIWAFMSVRIDWLTTSENNKLSGVFSRSLFTCTRFNRCDRSRQRTNSQSESTRSTNKCICSTAIKHKRDKEKWDEINSMQQTNKTLLLWCDFACFFLSFHSHAYSLRMRCRLSVRGICNCNLIEVLNKWRQKNMQCKVYVISLNFKRRRWFFFLASRTEYVFAFGETILSIDSLETSERTRDVAVAFLTAFCPHL